MKVTYIEHSGFMIEWAHCVWLIDYYRGQIPEFDKQKKIIIFCSHAHSDHFNPKIFSLFEGCEKAAYILSEDIRSSVTGLGLTGQQQEQITYVKPRTMLMIEDGSGHQIAVKTLLSTDCGVAFLLEYEGQQIYHAGDLNWWVWKGEEEQEYWKMTTAYKAEIARLCEISDAIDIAFVPLDPRQEEWYSKGMLYFITEVEARKIFPMHFWNQYEIIERFLSSAEGKEYSEAIVPIQFAGEHWTL